MKNLKSKFILAGFLLVASLTEVSSAVALVRLASDWQVRAADGQMLPFGQWEGDKLDEAAGRVIAPLSATKMDMKHFASRMLELSFQLYLNEHKFYIQPATFMAKRTPTETCTPVDFDNAPIYACEEGQRLTRGCHILFFNSNFESVGTYELSIRVPFEYYCNAIPAIGIADKNKDALLITVQYFAIDHAVAQKISELGNGWVRQTILVHIGAKDGKIWMKQDDECLGNPNAIDTIPDARQKLGQCRSQQRAGL
jgi:hypothetical protein